MGSCSLHEQQLMFTLILQPMNMTGDLMVELTSICVKQILFDLYIGLIWAFLILGYTTYFVVWP